MTHLSLYKGEFLQNFFLKSNETYDLWLTKMRSHLEQVYIKTCYQNIDQMMETADFEEIEDHIFKLISIDEFEERHYQLLMKLYQKYQRFGKVIETYYKLVNLLDEELGIAPSPASQAIYEEVVAKDRNHKKIKKFLRTTNDFFGRLDVIKELEDYFNAVYDSKQSHTMLLLGGTGIGKKTVTRQVLSNQTSRYQIVTAECFHEENSHSLQVIKDILEGLGDLVLEYQLMTLKDWNQRLEYFFPSFLKDKDNQTRQDDSISLTRFMIDILKKLSSQKATVILIEDIHWMSAEAVDILQTLVNHLEDAPLALVLTKHLNSNNYLDQFFNHLISRKRIDFLKINNLSEKESMDYLKQTLGHLNSSQQDYNKIYQISEGNPFFLSEYANLLLKGQKFTP
ncbi:AAA family ATPase [Streptococcus iniae]